MTTTTNARPRLNLENLEDRLTPAYTSAGALYITGSNYNDSVAVNYYGSYCQVYQNGNYQYFALSSVSRGVVFYGYGGDDYFVNNTYLPCTAYGMDGNDTLIGGYSGDYLDGGNGFDKLYGRQGNDTLVAGYDYSYNVLWGGDGNDNLYGGYGRDDMYGEAGNDYMAGSYGDDYLFGGDGNDTLYGQDGNDYLNGGNGYDYLFGGNGYDYLYFGEYNVQ